jgi:magnesium-transporting ATPase (P-type)
MTVALKSETNILIFVKGADSSISKLLSPNQKYLKDIISKTEEMSRTGLRSLWFAYKTLPIYTNINALS